MCRLGTPKKRLKVLGRVSPLWIGLENTDVDRVVRQLAVDRAGQTENAGQFAEVFDRPAQLLRFVADQSVPAVSDIRRPLPIFFIRENPRFLQKPVEMPTVPTVDEDRWR